MLGVLGSGVRGLGDRRRRAESHQVVEVDVRRREVERDGGVVRRVDRRLPVDHGLAGLVDVRALVGGPTCLVTGVEQAQVVEGRTAVDDVGGVEPLDGVLDVRRLDGGAVLVLQTGLQVVGPRLLSALAAPVPWPGRGDLGLRPGREPAGRPSASACTTAACPSTRRSRHAPGPTSRSRRRRRA